MSQRVLLPPPEPPPTEIVSSVNDPVVTGTVNSTYRLALRAPSAGHMPSGVSKRAALKLTFLFTRPLRVAAVAVIAPSVIGVSTMVVPETIGQVAVAGVPEIATLPFPVSEIVPALALGAVLP